MKTKLLFVCLGNICRSPTAEAIMNKLIEDQGLQDQIICDSAGTSGHHEGELADPRMRAHGVKRNYKFDSRSRPFESADFEKFNYILVMDDRNLEDVLKLDYHDEHQSKVMRIVEFCDRHEADHIPDPYYGGADGFERVLDLLEDACEGFLRRWQNKEI